MWLWLPKYSEEQETFVQKAGLLWIMGAEGGNGDSPPSIMLLHSGQHCSQFLCLTQLYRVSRICWTYGNISLCHQKLSQKPKVHCAISSINAGLLRDLAALCYLLYAFIIWWLWPVQLEGQEVAAPHVSILHLNFQLKLSFAVLCWNCFFFFLFSFTIINVPSLMTSPDILTPPRNG